MKILRTGDLVEGAIFHKLSIVVRGGDEHNYPLMEECYTGERWISYGYFGEVIRAKTNENA